jgi:hypothetical protein
VLDVMVCGLAPTAASAEKGQIIRAGDLLAQPFIDAPSAAKLTASQPVTIVERRGPWVSVQANGKTGWVRLLNLRLEPGVAVAGLSRPSTVSRPSGLSSLMQTGSSGRTVTTGVKGMDEEDIRASTPNYEELTLLEGLGVDAADARASAEKAKLAARSVAYLDKKRGK